MRKFIFISQLGVFVLFLFMPLCFSAESLGINDDAEKQLIGKKAYFTEDGFFYVHYDYRSRLNHFFPCGWMGDYGDIGMDEKWKDNPQSGETCLKWSYSAQGKQGAGFSGAYWQMAHGDLGAYKDGWDLRGAKKITFWARGEQGNVLY